MAVIDDVLPLLQDFDSDLEEMKITYGLIRDRCVAVGGGLSTMIRQLESDWDGPAEQRAVPALRGLRSCIDTAADSLAKISTALNNYQWAVRAAAANINGYRSQYRGHWPSDNGHEGLCVNGLGFWDQSSATICALFHPVILNDLLTQHDEQFRLIDEAARTFAITLRPHLPDRTGLIPQASPLGPLPTGGLFGFGVGGQLRDYATSVMGLTPDQLDQWISDTPPDQIKSIWDALDPADRARFAGTLLASASPLLFAKIIDAIPAVQPYPGDGAYWTTPTAQLKPAASTAWRPATSFTQRGYGDCWFASSLAAVLNADPDWVERNVKTNPNGTITVTFFDQDGQPLPVTVTPEIPTTNGVRAYGMWSTPTGSDLTAGYAWPAIVEKAFAQVYTEGNGPKGTYAGIEGDFPDNAIPYLTGQPARHQTIDPTPITTALTNPTHQAKVTVYTGAIDPSEVATAGLKGLYGNHAYWVTLDSNGDYLLHNPWGPQSDPRPMTAQELEHYLRGMTIVD